MSDYTLNVPTTIPDEPLPVAVDGLAESFHALSASLARIAEALADALTPTA